MLFSDDDRRRIAQAITAAERTTSGEIVAVVVGSSASYVSVAPLATLASITPFNRLSASPATMSTCQG